MSDQNSNRPTSDRRVIGDDEFKRMMRASTPGVIAQNSYQAVTLAIIAVNVIVYAVEFVLSGFNQSISTDVLVDMGAMFPPAVQSPADAYRFVVPMFLHMDVMHLLFNVAAIYSVGALLEQVLGKGSFVLLYLVAGITGNVASYLTALLTGDVLVVSAGASTSAFGLFLAVALLGVFCRDDRAFLREYGKGMWAVIGVNVAYSLLVPGISISGHLGGAVGGIIALLMLPSRATRIPVAVRIIVAVLWLAAVAAVVLQGEALGSLLGLSAALR